MRAYEQIKKYNLKHDIEILIVTFITRLIKMRSQQKGQDCLYLALVIMISLYRCQRYYLKANHFCCKISDQLSNI